MISFVVVLLVASAIIQVLTFVHVRLGFVMVTKAMGICTDLMLDAQRGRRSDSDANSLERR